MPASCRERRFGGGDGLPLFFRDYEPARTRTSATAALCLGGLTRNSKDFEGVARRIAASGRRVLCPDYRGRGRSSWDPDWRRYQPATYLEDIRHLLAVTGVDRVVVVGTSLGGLLAMALGVAMPTAVAGVLLNDVGPEVVFAALGDVIAFMKDDRPMPDWETATRRLRATFPDFPARNEQDWRAIARATFREDGDGRIRFDWDPAVVRPLLRASGSRLDVWSLFRSLRRVPVAVVRGEKSGVLTAETMDRMADSHPRLRTATVPDVGHAPALAEPEARAALDWLLETATWSPPR